MQKNARLHGLRSWLIWTSIALVLAACGGSTTTGGATSAGGAAQSGGATQTSGGGAATSAAGAARSGATSAAGGGAGGTTAAAGGTSAAGSAPVNVAGSAAGVSNKFSGTTLNMIAANHAWNTAIQPYLPEFQKVSGIKINLSSFGEDQLSQQLTVKLTAQSPDLDMFMFRPLQEGRLFANNGWLADITSHVQNGADYDWNDFQAPARGTVTFDGKVYGSPIVTEREILYYRKDLLQAKGIAVPQTLDDLRAAAEKLNDPSAGVYGFVARGQRSPAVTQFSSFLYSMGGDWAKDGHATIASPEAIKAYQLYGELLQKFGPQGVQNMSWPQAIGLFGQGKAAMYTDADSLYPNLLDKTKSTVTDKVGYAVFPAGSAGAKPYNVTSWALGVAASSKNKEAAFEFIRWATSKDMVARLQSGGLPGARTSVWNSPQGTAGFPADLAQVIQKSAQVGVDHDRPVVVQVGKARDIVGNPIITGIQGQDVAAAAKQANSDFEEFLKTDQAK